METRNNSDITNSCQLTFKGYYHNRQPRPENALNGYVSGNIYIYIYKVPKLAQEETEKLHRSIAIKKVKPERTNRPAIRTTGSQRHNQHIKSSRVALFQQTLVEKKVAKNITAFIMTTKNIMQPRISLLENAQDLQGENVVCSKGTKQRVRKWGSVPYSRTAELNIAKVNVPQAHL